EEWAVRTADDNRRDMSKGITSGTVTGLLAYVDGKPVGWSNYGETTRLNGVMHRFGLNAAEQQGVGSLACFVIAAPYRQHGVASMLLESALDRLRARRVKTAEAYPVKELKSAQSNYRGPLSMYLQAGFEPYRDTERAVVAEGEPLRREFGPLATRIDNVASLVEGEAYRAGSLAFDVLHTPGHSPGGISLKIDGLVFTGDALFAGSIGRSDFAN